MNIKYHAEQVVIIIERYGRSKRSTCGENND